MKLPLLSPLSSTTYLATSTLSPPWSPLTQEGIPNCCTAHWKAHKAVSARLLVKYLKTVIILEKPSIPPWITDPHLIRLWCPSMCHHEFGQGTLYTLLVITAAPWRALFPGSTLLIAARTRSRCTKWPRDLTYPVKYDCPVVVPCCDINKPITSSSHRLCLTTCCSSTHTRQLYDRWSSSIREAFAQCDSMCIPGF